MSLSYCEVCGVLIQGDGPVLLPEGVICSRCLSSRQALVTATPQQPGASTLQFECCYCHSLLRLKPVSKRTRVRCPKCNDAFYLHEDGRLEARLEGSKTAVLQQNDVAPLEGKVERPGDKTQPIKRSEALEAFSRQHAMLEELKPKRLDFVEALPEREQSELNLDTGRYRRPEEPGPGALDLVPDDAELQLVGDEDEEALRASEEGAVDLGVSELRHKARARDLRDKAPRRGGKKGRGARRAPSQRVAAAPQAPPDDAEREERRRERERRSKESERRAKESERRGAEVARQQERRTVGGTLLWLAFLLPLALGILLAVSSQREAGWTRQGRFGRQLEDLGRSVEDGIRSLNGFLPPALRLPFDQEDSGQ